MSFMSISYQGGLRNKATHALSNTTLITDAPPDNNGKGESFSPTDLVATALGTCMITLMGITADKKEIKFESCEAEIEKIMASDPRRVQEVKIKMKIKDLGYSEKEKTILKQAALNCPVAKSVHPDLIQNVSFEFV